MSAGRNQISRRTLMGSAIGLGAFVSLAGGSYLSSRNVSFAQGTPVRRSIHTLVRADGTLEPELSRYVDALKALQDNSPMIWERIRNLHDEFCLGAGPKEVHGNWTFIPWHRAYLVTYERLLREASKDDSVVVPYWDWYASDEFPAVFNSGPLNHSPRNIQPRPINNADRGYGETEATNYDKFAAFGLGGFLNPESFFGANVPTGSPFAAGRPELGGHGGMHNYVGGDMGDLNLSARDPCFYSHHANVDRLMELWKTNIRPNDDSWRTESSDWLNIEYEFRFDDTRVYKYRVGDLLDTETVVDVDGEALGYTYESVQADAAVAALPMAPFAVELNSTAADAAGEGSAGSGAATLSFEPPSQVISFGSLDVTPSVARTEEVTVPPATQNVLKNFLDRDRSAEFQAFNVDGGAATPGGIPGRVILRLENIRIPPRNVQVNFFVNTPTPTYSEVAQSENYLASFNYIPSREDAVELDVIEIDVSDKLRDRIDELSTLQISTITAYLPADSEPISIGNISLVVE